MGKVDVSVIMAEYNTDIELLKKSINSILNQTFTEFEFIIIDDCGKNDLYSIVDEFNDPRITVYKNEENLGLIKSLNKAIELSQGNYIVRMDTDDFAYHDRIELQYKFIKNNPEYSVVGMKCDFFDGNKIYGNSQKNGKITRKDLLKGVPIVHPTVIMKKEDIIAVGGYPNFKRCEDYALWIELYANEYNLYVMNETGLRYTIRKDDYSKRKLNTRKDLFKLLKTQYKKLKPPFYYSHFIMLKNFVAGIFPSKLMNFYHKIKFKN